MGRNRRRVWLAVCLAAALFGAAGCGIVPEGFAGKSPGEDIAKERTDAPAAADVLPEESSGTTEEAEGFSDNAGQAQDGSDLRLSFVLSRDLSGLPQEVQDQIVAINQGKPPGEALRMENLKGYYALLATNTVIGTDKESGEEAPGRGRLTLYVPNLLAGLADVSVLFYDNVTGTWNILAAERVDVEKKTLSVILPGSGTLTVIYKRQE